MPLWVHVQNASGLSSVEERAHGTVKNDPDTGGKPGKVRAKANGGGGSTFQVTTLEVALSG